MSIGILKKTAIVLGVLLALSTFLFLLTSYGMRSVYGPPISGKGTVEYFSFGEFDSGWGLIIDGDHHLNKIVVDSIWGESYFPSEFQVSGLRVEFVGYPHHLGMVGFTCEFYWNDYITLIDIDKI